MGPEDKRDLAFALGRLAANSDFKKYLEHLRAERDTALAAWRRSRLKRDLIYNQADYNRLQSLIELIDNLPGAGETLPRQGHRF